MRSLLLACAIAWSVWNAPWASADPAQPTTTNSTNSIGQQCDDPAFARANPELCNPNDSPFGMGGSGRGGGGLLSGLLHHLGL